MLFSNTPFHFQGIEWLDRAGRALRNSKEEGSRLWPLYKARCGELRALKKLEKKKDADLAALKAENEALRARAATAEREAEVAVRRKTELQEALDAEMAKNAQQGGRQARAHEEGVAAQASLKR